MATRLVPHDPTWASDFAREAEALMDIFGEYADWIEHIGSTSIHGILAKPVIDILVAASNLDAIAQKSTGMQSIGYEAKGEYGLAGRHYFRKVDANGVRTHHVHVFQTGSDALDRHLAFRDYLRANPEIAQAYSDIKAGFSHLDRKGYQAAKSEWIIHTQTAALTWQASAKFLLSP